MTNLAKTSEIIEKVLRQFMEEKFEREWVGLTDEEIDYIWGISPGDYEDKFAFPRAIEAKLKEKNT
jgi:hypothetical protein